MDCRTVLRNACETRQRHEDALSAVQHADFYSLLTFCAALLFGKHIIGLHVMAEAWCHTGSQMDGR